MSSSQETPSSQASWSSTCDWSDPFRTESSYHSCEESQSSQKNASTLEVDGQICAEDDLEWKWSDSELEDEVANAKAQLPWSIKDLESEDLDDPLMVAEYATDIFNHLREIEGSYIANANYMDRQDELDWKARGILVDWLIEVQQRFSLLPETFCLAVNLVDWFLSVKVIQLERLQLIGMAATLIAAKYEEVMPLCVGNLCEICDDAFTVLEILDAEKAILSVVEYDLNYPTPMNFLCRISKADGNDKEARTIGQYLVQIALLDHRLITCKTSHVAAGAMHLARLMLNRCEWDETIAYYAGYTEEEIDPVARLMVDYLARPVVHEACFIKHSTEKFQKVSLRVRQWARKRADAFGIMDKDKTLYQIASPYDWDDEYDVVELTRCLKL